MSFAYCSKFAPMFHISKRQSKSGQHDAAVCEMLREWTSCWCFGNDRFRISLPVEKDTDENRQCIRNWVQSMAAKYRIEVGEADIVFQKCALSVQCGVCST